MAEELPPFSLAALGWNAKSDRLFADAVVKGEGVIFKGTSGMSLRVLPHFGLAVLVKTGSAVIDGDEHPTQGKYLGTLESPKVISLSAAHATLPRIDRIVARIRDAQYEGTENKLDVYAIPGTPTSLADLSNLNGAAAVPKTTLLLGNVLVDPTATSLVLEKISDTRTSAIMYDDTPDLVWKPGNVILHAGTTAPEGWLLCDGSLYSRTLYAALFAEIGIVHGAGDGVTTFAVPDTTNRFVQGGGTVGTTGGASTHTHPLSSDAYALIGFDNSVDRVSGRIRSGIPSYTADRFISATVGSTPVSKTIATPLSGDTDSASSLPPYVRLNYIIKI